MYVEYLNIIMWTCSLCAWLQRSFRFKHCVFLRKPINTWDDRKCHSGFSLLGWNMPRWRKWHFSFRSASQPAMAVLLLCFEIHTLIHTVTPAPLVCCLLECEITHTHVWLLLSVCLSLHPYFMWYFWPKQLRPWWGHCKKQKKSATIVCFLYGFNH